MAAAGSKTTAALLALSGKTEGAKDENRRRAEEPGGEKHKGWGSLVMRRVGETRAKPERWRSQTD